MSDHGQSAERQLIEDFSNLFYGQGKTVEAFNRYVDEQYIQHNPMADNGRDNAVAMLEGLMSTFPEFSADIKRIAVEGDLAFVHSHVRMTSGEPGMAVVDIFRIANGLIVEHWDVIQAVPTQSANSNSMF